MWIVGFILGAILGSFVKAAADRSLASQTLLGRSKCVKCKHKLAWYDLIPLFSYILLHGKCRYCHKKLGTEYLVVEIVMGILIAFLFWQSSTAPELLFKTFFITILAILFLTDLKGMFIPDKIVLPSILIALIFLISIEPLLGSVIMAVLISGFFYFLIVITKGRGMGGGDVKLGALMGLCLGFPNAITAIMVAFLSGAIWSMALILRGKKHFGQAIAFGPFLVIGSLVALFWGDQILNIYLKLST